ncbi:Uncharacterised protein [Metamycoplasma arthritidis]|uniref:Uncharacterized protein n=1 Tax=Metamycoplasma arthritidis (strain 158L3-1) TaxID=243272 RepID=B3PMY3_META1|nr:hypothetical protein [Metamycoplasma arthritidis]ACF07385.1 hypothetical protein MARTH_orf590 [Metamycoplasma arthritidis 158L3-1]VEU78906.1 Uncharacterised protein [Metamycoplasma arthritidis]
MKLKALTRIADTFYAPNALVGNINPQMVQRVYTQDIKWEDGIVPRIKPKNINRSEIEKTAKILKNTLEKNKNVIEKIAGSSGLYQKRFEELTDNEKISLFKNSIDSLPLSPEQKVEMDKKWMILNL